MSNRDDEDVTVRLNAVNERKRKSCNPQLMAVTSNHGMRGRIDLQSFDCPLNL